MRGFSFLTVLFVAPLLITGCWGPVDGTLVEESAATNGPVESIDDELRSLDAPFEYDTLLPVVVSLEVHLTDGGGTLLSADAAPVFVTIRDSKMQELLTGGADASGHFLDTMALPGAYEDILISVEAPGFEPREFVVNEMVRYSVISRTILLRTAGDTLESSAVSGLTDSDGDEIPDIYDADPKNKDVAFKKKPVGGGWITVAFEDNFPEVGDGDFNDFIARYSVVEELDGSKLRIKITGEVEALARVASYDHSFGIIFGHPGYYSTFTVTHYDSEGTVVAERTGSSSAGSGKNSQRSNLVIFESTKGAFDRPGGVTVDNGYPDSLDSDGHTASFTINLSRKKKVIDPNPKTALETVEHEKQKVSKKYIAAVPPYDPYLYIYDTTYDVHLPGMDPLPDGVSNNPPEPEGFLDDAGYPRALIVPTNWGYPIERRHIEVAYPDFELWRTSGGAEKSDWYLNPVAEHVIVIE